MTPGKVTRRAGRNEVMMDVDDSDVAVLRLKTWFLRVRETGRRSHRPDACDMTSMRVPAPSRPATVARRRTAVPSTLPATR